MTVLIKRDHDFPDGLVHVLAVGRNYPPLIDYKTAPHLDHTQMMYLRMPPDADPADLNDGDFAKRHGIGLLEGWPDVAEVEFLMNRTDDDWSRPIYLRLRFISDAYRVAFKLRHG